MPGPIKPKDIAAKKTNSIPEEVFEVFNDLIAKDWDGYSATVKQEEALKLIAIKLDISNNKVFKNKYLDIESSYRKAGWKVEYDKPGYCETYKAFFVFSKK